MADLFHTEPPNAMSIVARGKLGLSESHTCYKWKRLEPDGFLVGMAEQFIKSRGPNKGRIGWRGNRHEVFVSYAEIDAARLDWEKQTGKCYKCGGSGQMWNGSSVLTGKLVVSYTDCDRCSAKGTSPIKQTEQ